MPCVQVEVDLQTQKPSQILEQQTRDWVKSGGISPETNDDKLRNVNCETYEVQSCKTLKTVKP